MRGSSSHILRGRRGQFGGRVLERVGIVDKR